MKLAKLVTALIVAALMPVFITVTAIAEEGKKSGEPGSGPNPFTDCGIGAALFPTSPVGAVTSNVIWDAGTTAVTSATASPETCNGKRVATAKFIYETYVNVVDETAIGNGEHVTAMLEMLGCPADTHRTIITKVRDEFRKTVESPNYTQQATLEKAAGYYNMLISTLHSDFNGQCAS